MDLLCKDKLDILCLKTNAVSNNALCGMFLNDKTNQCMNVCNMFVQADLSAPFLVAHYARMLVAC